MRIPQSFINDVLARVNIVDIIERFVTFKKKTGDSHIALCPFHQEKSPSFSVSQNKQFYHCFGCGVSGNAITFLMEYERLTFVESVEMLAHEAGMQVPREVIAAKPANDHHDIYSVLQQAEKFYQHHLQHNERAKAYLAKRGFLPSTVQQFSIGYAPAGWNNLIKHLGDQAKHLLVNAGMLIQKEQNYYDRFRDRIMFPIYDRRGRVIAFGGRVINPADEPKYLNSPETPVFHKSDELYGLYEACKANKKLSRVIVVEGYVDVTSLFEHGITYAVATLGTAISVAHIHNLTRYTSEIIFCFDGDNAGRKAAWHAMEIVLPILRDDWKLKFMFLPEGQDPDTQVRLVGKDGFTQLVDNAKPLMEFFLEHLTAQVNLRSVDGRGQLAHLARQYLKNMPQQLAIRESLLQELQKLTQIDLIRLSNLLTEQISPLPATNHVAPKTPSKKLLSKRHSSPLRIIIALLLQHPQLIEHFDDEILKFELSGINLLIKLVAIIKNHPKLSTGAIIEQWREQPELPLINKLANYNCGIFATEEDLIIGFKDSLRRLKRQIIEQEIEQLMVKASRNECTADEKHRLHELILQSKLLS